MCVQLNHIETGACYALKSIRPDRIGDRASADRFLDELTIWLSASMCDLVVEALAVVEINESPSVLSIWMHNGDLMNALRSFGPQQKFEVLVRIVRGLSWVHDNLGVIHRDLKPSNILLDDTDLAYIGDWGLARPIGYDMAMVRKSLAAYPIERPDRTEQGSFLGTITYAAPEQILCASEIDHRADIYALGCMMFEFETRATPFSGQTVEEIAFQHINTSPPNLQGWLKRSELGLEKIVARCLQKRPTARYSSYSELEADLVHVAKKRGFSLERCVINKRYDRAQLGKGHLKLDKLINEAIRTKSATARVAAMEFDTVIPFLREAHDLIALERYQEAERLLRPHFIPEILDEIGWWSVPHTMALNYAFCVLMGGERLPEAMSIFRALDAHEDKPAEFYANYSLALLKDSNPMAAKVVCERGLRRHPDDLDIHGNYTIALGNIGDLDRAEQSALKRITLRRDVHSIEEFVGVLLKKAKRKRESDLPEAISLAKKAGEFITEGLTLNPNFYQFYLKQVQLRRFALDGRTVSDLCQKMFESEECPDEYRIWAFEEMLETWVQEKSVDASGALALIRKVEGRARGGLSPGLTALKMKILARHCMIGWHDPSGARIIIPEVKEYFLATNRDDSYSDPVMSAEVLAWIGETESALRILEDVLSASPNHWEGIKRMAVLQLELGKSAEALQFVQTLTAAAPWRAESYYCLSYVAERVGKVELAKDAKKRGAEVFEKESVLFAGLRKFLDEVSAQGAIN